MLKLKRKGTLMVEFAITLPVMLLLLMNLFYMGLCVRDATIATNIIRESGRYASVQLAAEPVEEVDDQGNKRYVMQDADQAEVTQKIVDFTRTQCNTRLAFYRCNTDPSLVVEEGIHSDEKLNKKVRIAFTVDLIEDFSYLGFGCMPQSITRSVVFRIEDHSIEIESDG